MQRDDGDDECDAADAIVGFEAVQFGSWQSADDVAGASKADAVICRCVAHHFVILSHRQFLSSARKVSVFKLGQVCIQHNWDTFADALYKSVFY